MSKEILINTEEKEKRVALLEGGKLQDFYIEHPEDRTIVGNVYKGRINDIVPSVGAAFVDIGQSKNGFLYLSDVSDRTYQEEFDFDLFTDNKGTALDLKKNQEILVQVTKEPFSGKGARLTSHVAIPGRYLVLMPFDKHIGLSRKIDEPEERKRIKEVLCSIKMAQSYGLIVRTAAWGKDKKSLMRDFYFLLNLWNKIKNMSKRYSAPHLLYEDYDLVLRTVRDYFTEDVDKLIVDSKIEYKRIHKFVGAFFKPLARRVVFYRDKISLFEKKKVEEEIDQIYGSKIYLHCGGHIVIEQTEGLLVVDVNSGGFSQKKLKQEEAAFLVNMEAAKEIARQLKLRDLSGIIVVDFIDMMKEANRRKLLRQLKIALSDDKAKTDVIGISRLGLVQMTRERIRRSIESIFYRDCPYCHGKGKIKSENSMVSYVVRYLRRELVKVRARRVNVSLHPSVAKKILHDNRRSIKNLEGIFRKRIQITEDKSLHIESVKISQHS